MCLLTDEEIAASLDRVRWHREGAELVRDWRFADFAAAMAFVNRVAALAEAVDHHPDIRVHRYRLVRLSVTSHAAGGLTERDFAFAQRVDDMDRSTTR
jgi:4a-hydroxytetrahydrobiopterin dehydratase